tara:strand:- start:9051 stop:9500 length:450 start_codon:yes stop_codon:yes gene_type:complete
MIKLESQNSINLIIIKIKYIIKKLLILFVSILFLFYWNVPNSNAAQGENIKAKKLQIKVSNKFTKKFCNSIGFGISKDSAIKFAIGENNKEISNSKLISLINRDQLEEEISTKIVDSCGGPLNLFGQKGVDDFKIYLVDNDAMNAFGGD